MFVGETATYKAVSFEISSTKGQIMRAFGSLAALIAACSIATAANATFVLTYESEAPGIENSTSTFSFDGVETFSSLTPGYYPSGFQTTFGGTPGPSNTTITLNYTPDTAISSGGPGVQINAADEYGGAGGTGQYIVAFTATPYELNLSSTDLSGGINYFGYWLSALDKGNYVQFYGNGGQLLFTFDPQDVLNAISSSEYFGNPNANYIGEDSGEPFVFLNFYDTTGTFSKVVFYENNSGGGYESDNHTVGHYLTMSGTDVSLDDSTQGGVPEPASWTLMILGVGAIGAMARRRRVVGLA
jgi:hypothetical protein